MSDVLEQWRAAKERWIISGEANEMIVGLENEIERLRMALLQIAGKVSQSDKSFAGDMASEIARAALGEGK